MCSLLGQTWSDLTAQLDQLHRVYESRVTQFLGELTHVELESVVQNAINITKSFQIGWTALSKEIIRSLCIGA